MVRRKAECWKCEVSSDHTTWVVIPQLSVGNSEDSHILSALWYPSRKQLTEFMKRNTYTQHGRLSSRFYKTALSLSACIIECRAMKTRHRSNLLLSILPPTGALAKLRHVVTNLVVNIPIYLHNATSQLHQRSYGGARIHLTGYGAGRLTEEGCDTY